MSIGGEGRFTRLLAYWLDSNGHDVTVLGTKYFGTVSKTVESTNSGVDLYPIETSPNKPRISNPPYIVYSLSRLLISFRLILEIIKIWRKYRDNGFLIHAQDTGYAGLAAAISGKLLKVPVIITSHGIRHITLAVQRQGKLNRLVVRLEAKLDTYTAKNATVLIAVSPYIKAFFERNIGKSSAINKPLIVNIPPPIDTRQFRFNPKGRIQIRQEFSIRHEVIVFGYIGRLVKSKNLTSLISAFSNMRKRYGSGIMLLIVGTGDQEIPLREQTRTENLGKNVIFTGLRSDIVQILSAIDVFVLPSLTEGLSTALLEAMATGRVVICSNIPGNAYLVEDGETGLLFNKFGTESISDAMKLTIESSEIRERLSRKAMLAVRKFDKELIFERILRLYDSTVSGKTDTISTI